MLNKINQKKSIPGNMLYASCLSCICVLFQVKVVAQEKESDFKISNVIVSLHVTSKSTQQDLEGKNSLNDLWNRFNIYRTQS
jgi:hypothetical protein